LFLRPLASTSAWGPILLNVPTLTKTSATGIAVQIVHARCCCPQSVGCRLPISRYKTARASSILPLSWSIRVESEALCGAAFQAFMLHSAASVHLGESWLALGFCQRFHLPPLTTPRFWKNFSTSWFYSIIYYIPCQALFSFILNNIQHLDDYLQ